MKYPSIILILLISSTICLNAENNKHPVKEAVDIFKLSDEEIKEYRKPIQRFYHFNKQRAYPGYEIPDGAREKAINQMSKMIHYNNKKDRTLADQPEWTCIGPYNVGGRIKSIAISPDETDIVYAAAAAGGIWKSTDAGDSWEPIFDYENSIAFGSICIDPNNPDIIYAATGESVVGGSNIYLGSGVYKTTNGGDSWEITGLTDVGAFSKIYVHPRNSNLIVAGATSRKNGFYKSTDAGLTWQRMYEGNVTDLTINPDDENDFFIGVYGSGLFRSQDGGQNFDERNDGLNFEQGAGRFSVQFAPNNPRVLYTLFEVDLGTGTNDLGHARIYKSTNNGFSWNLNYVGAYSFFNNQGMYDNYIAVHPQNETSVFAGGIDVHHTSTGSNWDNITNGYSGGNVHVDQHCIAFDPENPNTIYIGNDGGVFKSTNGGASFTDCNTGLHVTQFYAMAVDQTKDNRTYGGTQDNGTLGNVNYPNWAWVMGGDGFRVLVDHEDPDIIYGEQPYGAIWIRDISSGYFDYLDQGIVSGDQGHWNSPLVRDPNNPEVFYHGRHRVYISFEKGEEWYEFKDTYNEANQYTAIAVAKGDEELLYAGTETGEVLVTTNLGEDWIDVSENGLVSRFVTDIETSPHDPAEAYITFSGFGAQNVFKTTDKGQSWKNIGTKLPDIPCNAIAIHPLIPGHLFVATDIGVFASFNDGETWFPYGRDLPKVPVLDIVFRENLIDFPALKLRIATHGRSMWEIDVVDEEITEPEITIPAGGEYYISSTSQRIAWHGFEPPVTISYYLENEDEWVVLAEDVVSESMLWTIPTRPSERCRIKVVSQTDGAEKISNQFTISLKKKGSILQQNGVTFVPYGIAWDGKEGLYTTSFYADKLYKLNYKTFQIEKIIPVPGDSLFTDLTIDRNQGIIYMHQMYTTDGGGGSIIKLDTNGNVLDQFQTPGLYPIGIELINGALLLGDRDGLQMLSWFDLGSEKVVGQTKNPYAKNYGPRGICFDQEKYIYQVCTYFATSNALTEALVIKVDIDDLSTIVESMPLEGMNGIINGRGVEYDPADKNYWLTDFGGNLYKIAGFSTVTDVEDEIRINLYDADARIYPNPANDYTTVSFDFKELEGHLKIELANSLGQIVGTFFDKSIHRDSPDYVTIKTDDLANGVYYIWFTLDDKKILQKKLMVIR